MTENKMKLKKLLLFAAIAIVLACATIFYCVNIPEQEAYIDEAKINSIGLDQNQRKSLNSLEKIDDFPVYVMHFYGDYGFSDYLKEGRKISKYSDTRRAYNACSCIASLSNTGDKIFGRNFDYFYSPKLLLFTDPSDGYSSVSMVDLAHGGFTTENDIENASPQDLARLLNFPYLPLDGMNEYGLAVGVMIAEGTKTSIDPDKVTLGDLAAVRLILDRAKTVDEAVALLGKYNVYFPPGPPLHFMISDKEGKSVIIEFIEGEMKVITNEAPWQVSTNFLLYGSSEAAKNACMRYSTAERTLKEKNGCMTDNEVMELLKNISQDSTQWSAVYNMDRGDISLAIGKKYEDIKHYKLKMK